MDFGTDVGLISGTEGEGFVDDSGLGLGFEAVRKTGMILRTAESVATREISAKVGLR